VHFDDAGADRVAATGAMGWPRPTDLKVCIGYRDGFIGEGQIAYAGHDAGARAQLAADIVRERLDPHRHAIPELRVDLIGVDALHGRHVGHGAAAPYEVRVRVAGRARHERDAARIGHEVEALYTNGPAGGGGAVKSVREVVAVASSLVPRDRVTIDTHIEWAR
jgi:hypothetical protein